MNGFTRMNFKKKSHSARRMGFYIGYWDYPFSQASLKAVFDASVASSPSVSL